MKKGFCVWMQDNWNKWQGYSFYTSSIAIEKCVTVTWWDLSARLALQLIGGSGG